MIGDNMQTPADVDFLLDPLGSSEKLFDIEAIMRGEKPYPTAEEIVRAREQVDALRAKKAAMLRRLQMCVGFAAAVQSEGRRTLDENDEMLKILTAELGPSKCAEMAAQIADHKRAEKHMAESQAEVARLREYVQSLQERDQKRNQKAVPVDNPGAAELKTDEAVNQEQEKASRRRGRGKRRQR